MADIAGIIWRGPNGEREHLIRVREITTDEDRKHRNRQFRGYCPALEKSVRVYFADFLHG